MRFSFALNLLMLSSRYLGFSRKISRHIWGEDAAILEKSLNPPAESLAKSRLCLLSIAARTNAYATACGRCDDRASISSCFSLVISITKAPTARHIFVIIFMALFFSILFLEIFLFSFRYGVIIVYLFLNRL